MFVTFEGPDGSGKTTQVNLLKKYLSEAGQSVLTTREPGGTSIGESIRRLLLDMGDNEMHTRTETLLFNAARAQLIEEKIRPALVAGDIVLCDRFADSTLAYQGYGRQQDRMELKRLIEYATGGLSPDLTVYLDLSPERGLRRKLARHLNRLDALELSFHEQVRNGYQNLIEQQPHRWAVIDANRSRQEVHNDVVQALHQKLPSLASSR